MRAIHRLSAKGTAALGPGKFAGAGLWLVKADAAYGKWVLRVTVHGRQREIGSEPFPAVSLAEARKAKLKDDGKAGRWFSPLKLHILPRLVPVDVWGFPNLA